jgi:heptaprenylglyceryl phosphate synthase
LNEASDIPGAAIEEESPLSVCFQPVRRSQTIVPAPLDTSPTPATCLEAASSRPSPDSRSGGGRALEHPLSGNVDSGPISQRASSSPSSRRFRAGDSRRPRANPDSGRALDDAKLQATSFKFARYLPLLDPDAFSAIEFYQELEAIGYQQVLIGGTGSADVASLGRRLKAETKLTTILYPSGPESVAPADLVVLPDVMNSNAPHARPFGTAAIATAMNVALRGLPFVSVAYFVMGTSTAGWYFDAFPITSKKVLRSYAIYARMIGYRYLALDYEGCAAGSDPDVVAMLSHIEGLHLLVSEDVPPERAHQALANGAGTIITSSDMYEASDDPLSLAADFYDRLLHA